MLRYTILLIVIFIAVSCASLSTTEVSSESDRPDTVYVPRATINGYQRADSPYPNWSMTVPAFSIDQKPVSNREFLEFTKTHSSWKKSQIASDLHDGNYLKHWKGDETIDPADLDRPVRYVSYPAALAYCKRKGRYYLH